MQDPQDFNGCYEQVRQRFNLFAESRGLGEKINAFLVAEIEASAFNHTPYLLHMATDLVSMPIDEKISLDIVHHGIDYGTAYSEYNAGAALERQRKEVSYNLIETFKLLGKPENYSHALAHQKLLLKLNPHFLDSHHSEEFQRLREENTVDIQRFGQQAIVQQFGLLPTKDQVNALEAKLKAQGIEINDQLHQVLGQSTATCQSMENIVNYIQAENNAKLLHAKQEQKNADYKSLIDACDFVGALGRFTGTKELVTVAGIASAGIKIHRALDQFLSNNIGMAVINPFAAIGMAVLSVFSLFSRRQEDPSRLILKQLAVLSKQIRELHKDMHQHFGHLNEKLDHIFKKMLEAFEMLQINMTISVTRRLAEIQSELETLSRITKTGFEEILLRDLKNQVGFVEDVKEQICDSQISKADYEDRMRLLREFLLEKSCSPLLNGMVYSHLLQPRSECSRQLMGLLSAGEVSQLQGLYGLMACFAKQDLKVVELQEVDEKQLFHPGLWRIAFEAYCELKKQVGKNYYYDPKQINLEKFRVRLKNELKFIHQLHFNSELYKKLFEEIERCQLVLEADLGVYFQSIIPVIITSPKILFEIPEKLHGRSDVVDMTKKFFAKENLFNFLEQNKIELPKEFLDAEKLGLGYFEYKMHMPVSLHKKHHTHHNGYRLKEGDKAGLDISFVMGGQRTVLYSAGITRKHKETSLESMYQTLVKTCTKPREDMKLLCQQMSEIIKQHSISEKKQFAARVAAYLDAHVLYHRLLKLNYFLLAFLNCAGFSEELIKKAKEALLLTDMVSVFEGCAKHMHEYMVLPEMHFCSSETLKELCTSVLSGFSMSTECLFLQELLSLMSLNVSVPNAESQIYTSFFQTAQATRDASKAEFISHRFGSK